MSLVGRWITGGADARRPACLTYVLDNGATQSFELLLSIGAGTGLIYLLRWFWWRINAWCEITAMVSSFCRGARLLHRQQAGAWTIPAHVTLLITDGVTTRRLGHDGDCHAADRIAPCCSRSTARCGRPVRGGRRSGRETGLPPSPDSLPQAFLAWMFGVPDGVRRALRHRLPHLRTHRHRGILDHRLRGERRRACSGSSRRCGAVPRQSHDRTGHRRRLSWPAGWAAGCDATTAASLLDSKPSARPPTAGSKAMIPDARGRPFLDHILTSLADGGITDVCLVVPPVHDEIAAWYRAPSAATRLRLAFADPGRTARHRQRPRWQRNTGSPAATSSRSTPTISIPWPAIRALGRRSGDRG